MGKITVRCKQCGKEFVTNECWVNAGRGLFCSRECSNLGKRYIPPMLGKKHSQETIELMKKNRKGKATGSDNPNFGKPRTEEQKRKQSEKMKGRYTGEHNPMYGVQLSGSLNGFYGKKHTEETKMKISEANSGNIAWNKGMESQFKGVPRAEEVRKKISESHTGKPKSESHKESLRISKLASTPTGKDSIHWKGGITKLNLHIRVLPRYKIACKKAMERENYTDEFTKIRGGLLVCHHKIPQNVIIRMNNITNIEEAKKCNLLFDSENLLVMLSSAHDKFHNLYGDDKNIYELTPSELAELYT